MDKQMKIDLVQPRHNFAPKEGLGHVFMPTSLLSVAARLLEQGVEVNFYDENIRPAEVKAEVVGINAVGVPYIPEIIKLQERISEEQPQTKYLIGGQPVNTTREDGFAPEQFTRLFGENAFDGNDDKNLADLVGVEKLSPPEKTSLIPAYKLVSDEDMKEYLSRTFPLYVSQGCKNKCKFCPAQNKIPEKYRDQKIIREDLDYLVQRAKKVGLDEISIYMSNLDIFQTPDELYRFAQSVNEVKAENEGFEIKLRGLATVTSYLNVRDNQPEVIEEMVKAGLHAVGFGVDGWGKKVWESQDKGHNTKYKSIESIRSVREDYGITPEILMVFGHTKSDDDESLEGAYQITKKMGEEYRAIPRPHVAKTVVPGNDRWRDPKYAKQVEQLLDDPELFQGIDFTALPTEMTHPDTEQRELAEKYFLKICDLPGNTTQYLRAIEPGMTSKQIAEVKQFNEGRYDR